MTTNHEKAAQQLRGAQAASLQFAAACRARRAVSRSKSVPGCTATFRCVHPASCRMQQAGSLRSPEFHFTPLG
jgi:hypothetical protein